MDQIIKYVHEQLTAEVNLPDFSVGDNVTVTYRIREGEKERLQAYRGDVIQIKGNSESRTFTVRKMSNGVGVERIFPYACPSIAELAVNKRGRVRRSKLFYLRDRVGKKARIKEKKQFTK